MSYWDFAAPVLQHVVMVALVIFLIAVGVVGFLATLGSFMGDFMRGDIPRRWWILTSLLGILILSFGIPFANWLNAQWWPKPETQTYEQKTITEEIKKCQEMGANWYAVRPSDGGELVYICSHEPIYPEDLQPTP